MMSSPNENNQTNRPEALRKLAQLQIERLKKEEEEEQWISGEELYTEGSSDEDDTAIRSRRRKHRRAPGKDARRKQGRHKMDDGGKSSKDPPELKLESLTLTTEESHGTQSQEGSLLVTDGDEQIEISWRPKRGSIKLPNLSQEVDNPGGEGKQAAVLASTKKKSCFIRKNIKLAAEGMGTLAITDQEKLKLAELLADLDSNMNQVNAFRLDTGTLADIDARLEIFSAERTHDSMKLDDVREANGGHRKMKLQQRLQDIDVMLATLVSTVVEQCSLMQEVRPLGEGEIHCLVRDFCFNTPPRLSSSVLKLLLHDADTVMPHFQYRYQKNL